MNKVQTAHYSNVMGPTKCFLAMDKVLRNFARQQRIGRFVCAAIRCHDEQCELYDEKSSQSGYLTQQGTRSVRTPEEVWEVLVVAFRSQNELPSDATLNCVEWQDWGSAGCVVQISYCVRGRSYELQYRQREPQKDSSNG